MGACMVGCMPTWNVDQWNGVETENIIIGSADNDNGDDDNDDGDNGDSDCWISPKLMMVIHAIVRGKLL